MNIIYSTFFKLYFLTTKSSPSNVVPYRIFFVPIYSKITNRLIQSIGLDDVSIPIKNHQFISKIIRHTFIERTAHFLLFLYKVKQGIDPIICSFFVNNSTQTIIFYFSVTIYYFILGRMEYKEICLLICLFSISTIFTYRPKRQTYNSLF